eukprot:EG_transcript_33341
MDCPAEPEPIVTGPQPVGKGSAAVILATALLWGLVSCAFQLPNTSFVTLWFRPAVAPFRPAAASHLTARTGSLLRHAEAPRSSFAEVVWSDGVPVARRFKDAYFSKDGGLAEARHVFLRGTRLSDRIASTLALTIAETGFGTGLNFLAAWQLWDWCEKPAGATLRFVTVEKY